MKEVLKYYYSWYPLFRTHEISRSHGGFKGLLERVHETSSDPYCGV